MTVFVVRMSTATVDGPKLNEFEAVSKGESAGV
jgi:hypothetical protein